MLALLLLGSHEDETWREYLLSGLFASALASDLHEWSHDPAGWMADALNTLQLGAFALGLGGVSPLGLQASIKWTLRSTCVLLLLLSQCLRMLQRSATFCSRQHVTYSEA